MSAEQDFPDPLDDRRSTAAPSPDDLLSQMADDAIDKLIAEADAMDSPPAPPAPVTDFIPPPEPASIEAAPVEATLAPAIEPPVEDSAEASLQSILAAAEAGPPAAAEAAEPVTVRAPATHADLPPPVAAPPAEVLQNADVKALLADDAHAAGEKSSIVMLPLHILSAPLTHADDRIRTAVGQIAILTLLNAIAVLIYVFVVRHK